MYKLFVGGLPFSTTDDELRDLFAAHGAVASATVVKDRDTGRSKGFGFVEYENDDGEVFGLIVRSRNIFSNVGASFRTIFGGEVKGYTSLLSDSREHALARMREAAAAKGANAVLAMRFDSGDIGGVMNEVAAYGTAVKITPTK
jgi:uncharacterized protein YbjQ (UPF0145 family)